MLLLKLGRSRRSGGARNGMINCYKKQSKKEIEAICNSRCQVHDSDCELL